jgi:hypothetical protein
MINEEILIFFNIKNMKDCSAYGLPSFIFPFFSFLCVLCALVSFV